MKPQAIFFDIDGTLVSFKTHTIPASAKRAINMLRNGGIKIFIATGRPFCDIDNLEELVFDGYIASNGAYCVDSKGDIIDKHILSKESLTKLALYLEKKPFPCEFVTNEGNFINFSNDLVSSVSQLVNVPIPPVKPVSQIIEHDVLQIGAFVDLQQEAELMNTILTDCDSGRWHPDFTDIIVKNCNKAAGMDIFLTKFNIKKEHTMAFGDGGNDIPMLKHAATGVAMANANDEVKAAADYVTDSVDEDGIINALTYFKII